jgi:hypothetical protein
VERISRRQTTRFRLKVPFWIRLPKSPETPARLVKASNISGTGLYFISDLPLQIGTPVEVTLRMPEVVVGKHAREWCCRGKVVRVKPRRFPGRKPGIGVVFHYYEVLKHGIPAFLWQALAAGAHESAR